MHSVFTRTRDQSLRYVMMYGSSLVLLVIVGLPIIAIVLYAIFPHLNQGSFASAFSRFSEQFHSSSLIGATINSVTLACGVIVWTLVIALPLAVVRQSLRAGFGRMVDMLLMVPLLIPPYIGSMAWIQLGQSHGFIEQWFGFNFHQLLFSPIGLSLVMGLHLFPLTYASANTAITATGRGYMEAAMIYGANTWQRFSKIWLPLIMPALVASSLMIFVLSIEEFGTPDIIGRRFGFEVMVTAIHNKLSDWPIDLSGAAILSLLLIALAMVAYQCYRLLNHCYRAHLDGAQMGNQMTERCTHQFLKLALFMVWIVISVGLPLLAITLSALMKTQSGGLHWYNLGFGAFAALFSGVSDAMRALMTSLSLAFAAAILCCLIALVVSYTLIRLRPKGANILELLTVLPNAIPGMAVAVGLILTWNQPFWHWSPYNSLAILLLAYLCLMLPYPMRMLTAALRSYPKSLDEAGFISGANDWQVLWKILLPSLVCVGFASAVIVFAVSTRELVASLMLAPPGVETVATYVFNQFDQGSVNVGMAMSLMTIVLCGALISLGQWVQKKVSS
ncbi:ABC transporter permease [Celerinatantimonas sp. MCCC 1A17872]|uniref:ABC transporter permease n=1 Tax=Celerinatantimonas sp. MCCC 1A17872 TaxID=3177514 RepID=UPI0038CA0DD4